MRELRREAGCDARAPTELSRRRAGKLKSLHGKLRRRDLKTFVCHWRVRAFRATARRRGPCVKRCDIVHILVAPARARLVPRARASTLLTLLHALDQTRCGVGSWTPLVSGLLSTARGY